MPNVDNALIPSVLASEPNVSESSFSAQGDARSFVAALAFLLYDMSLTFDEEVMLIWRKPPSLFKFLYFYVRYVPIILQIPLVLVGSEITPRFHFTSHDCYIWQIYQGIISIAIMGPVDYILVARIYALYHYSILVQILVSIAYIATIVLMAVGLALSVPDLTFDNICHTVEVPNTLLINGVTEVVFQTLLFGLTSYKFITSIREGWNGVPIVRRLMRDGTWAFFVLFVVLVAQGAIYVVNSEGGILFGWVLSGFSFCGYRVLLNLNHLPRSRRGTSERSSSLMFTEYISPVPFSDWTDYSDMQFPERTYYTEDSGSTMHYRRNFELGVPDEAYELAPMSSPRSARSPTADHWEDGSENRGDESGRGDQFPRTAFSSLTQGTQKSRGLTVPD